MTMAATDDPAPRRRRLARVRARATAVDRMAAVAGRRPVRERIAHTSGIAPRLAPDGP